MLYIAIVNTDTYIPFECTWKHGALLYKKKIWFVFLDFIQQIFAFQSMIKNKWSLSGWEIIYKLIICER